MLLFLTDTLPLFTDVGSTASLNVHVRLLLLGTLVAPLAGVVATTLGRVVSATAELPVVKLKFTAPARFPATSFNPLAVTVYTVLGASKPAGVKINCVWSPLKLRLPAAGLPPPVTVIADPKATTSIGSLNCNRTMGFTATPSVPPAGLVDTSTGAVPSAPAPVVNVIDV